MPKYRKKPVVIEAFKYNHDAVPDWFVEKMRTDVVITSAVSCRIATLEGDMRACEGDYIIKDAQGEIYPRKPDIFEQTYELVEGE